MSVLLDLLLRVSEQLGIKEIFNGDSQTITELLDRRNGGTAVTFADDIVHCGLGYAAHAAEFIDGNVTLTTELQDAFLDGFPNAHRDYLF